MNKKYRIRVTEDMIEGFYYDREDYLSDSPKLFVIFKKDIYDFISDKPYKMKLIKHWEGREVCAVSDEAQLNPTFEPLKDIFLNAVGVYFQFENISDFTNFKIKYA